MGDLGEKGERGLTVIGEMMGPDFADRLRGAATSGKFGADIARMAIDFSFADSWGREGGAGDGLSRREKSIVVISLLIAMRQPAELKNHVRIGLANGLAAADFDSLLVQATSYVGFPCIASAMTAVIEALRDAGVDPDVQTSEERGLL